MKDDCECRYCKIKVNEYFCISCGYNFNECESFHEFMDRHLCPKCHPENCNRIWLSRDELEKHFPNKK